MADSNPFGDLSDPAQWMALVSDKAKLRQWVVSQAPKLFGAKSDLADYYVDRIIEKPGANPNEQKGSSSYWNGRITTDPNYAAYDGAGESSTTGGTGTGSTPTPPATTLGGPAAGPQGMRAYGGRLNGVVDSMRRQKAARDAAAAGTTTSATQSTADAYGAANRTRRKNATGGRQSTILGGFSGGSPTIFVPTILGR